VSLYSRVTLNDVLESDNPFVSHSPFKALSELLETSIFREAKPLLNSIRAWSLCLGINPTTRIPTSVLGGATGILLAVLAGREVVSVGWIVRTAVGFGTMGRVDVGERTVEAVSVVLIKLAIVGGKEEGAVLVACAVVMGGVMGVLVE